MSLITIKPDRRGRITIPDEIRKKLKIKEGDTLFVKEESGFFIIYTSEAIKIKLPK